MLSLKSNVVPSTLARSWEVYISEIDDVNRTKETNQDLRYLCIKNL